MAITPKMQEYPPLDYVVKLCESIQVKTEVDQRDRALIAFTVMSGARDSAIVSLPLECFNLERFVADQDPNKGVRTKFGKHIRTTLYPFNDALVSYVREWHKYLKEKLLFDNTKPLFPRTKIEQKSEEDSCFEGVEVEAEFWKTAQAMRNIFRRRAEAAGLRYYSPHKFRHTAVYEALKRARTDQQRRAISLNFGHENIGTTLLTYGKLDDFQVEEIISKMDFQENPNSGEGITLANASTEELMREIKKRMK